MTENKFDVKPTWIQTLQSKAATEGQHLPLPKLEKIKFDKWLQYPECESIESAGTHVVHSDADHIKIIYSESGIELSAPQEILDAGLKVLNLRDAQAWQDPDVQASFGSVSDPLKDQVAAYCLAQLNGGMFLSIPDELKLTHPVQIEWQAYATNMASHFIGKVGRNVSVTIIEEFTDQDIPGNQWVAMHEWIIEDNAHVNYVGFEHLSDQHKAFVRRHALVKRDATFDWSMAAFNRASSVADLKSRLIGSGASSTMATISVGTQEKVQGVNGNIINEAPHTFGQIIQHGVVFDAATITFNGIGHILKAAKNAESQQESRLLMFSKEGRGDVNPILLIDEYEVQAGHAASMGKVDAEQLYYLMTRGLSRQESEFLVMKGFLIHAFNDFESDIVRDKNLTLLNKALGVSR